MVSAATPSGVPRPYHRRCLVEGRKAIVAWTPRERWPATWHLTHAAEAADAEVYHGFVFRSAGDAAPFDTTCLALEVQPQPIAFVSWDDAMIWLRADTHR